MYKTHFVLFCLSEDGFELDKKKLAKWSHKIYEKVIFFMKITYTFSPFDNVYSTKYFAHSPPS
jgi:hypothetical protein